MNQLLESIKPGTAPLENESFRGVSRQPPGFDAVTTDQGHGPGTAPFELEADLESKRYYFKLYLIAGFPIVLAFLVRSAFLRDWAVLLLLTVWCVFTFAVWVAARAITVKEKALALLRNFNIVLVAMYAVFLFYTVGLQGDLSRLPWLCLIPLATLFISGKTAGRVGFLIVYIGVIVFDLFSPAADVVDMAGLKLRTYVSVLMLAYVAFSLEGIYRRLYLKVHRKNAYLQQSEADLLLAYNNLREEVDNRKEIEKALKQSEERFVCLFDTSPVLTALVTVADGRFVEANQAFFKITGYVREDVIGKRSVDLGLWPDPLERSRAGKLLSQTGHLEAYPVQLRMQNGAIRHFLWSAQVVDSFEEPCSIDCLVDVTERYEAETALRASERRYRNIFENVSDFLYVHDLDGNFIETNFAFKQKSGYSEEDFLNLNGGDMMPEGYHQRFDDYLQRVLLNGSDSGTMTVLTPEGHRMVVEYKNNLIHGPDGPIAVQGSARDVTDRIKAEEKLQEANRELEQRVKQRTAELEIATHSAQVASRAKTDFLATMSHEFRTPLNHIIGFTEVVLDRKFGPLTDRQHRYLANVLESSRHLLSLVNDVLDLSKVEAGKMELQLSPVNLKRLLESSVVMVMEKALLQKLHIEIEDDHGDETIQADERKLKQIMFNLLSNAVKFTPPNGRINVSLQRLVEGATPVMEVAVSDTGIGLAADDRERIFEPFEQADNSTSRSYQGTGLGLSLTRRFIELHGGRIEAESEGLGRGSTFRFRLPMEVSASRPAAATNGAS